MDHVVFFLDLVLSIFLIVYCFNVDFYSCKAPLDIINAYLFYLFTRRSFLLKYKTWQNNWE